MQICLFSFQKQKKKSPWESFRIEDCQPENTKQSCFSLFYRIFIVTLCFWINAPKKLKVQIIAVFEIRDQVHPQRSQVRSVPDCLCISLKHNFSFTLLFFSEINSLRALHGVVKHKCDCPCIKSIDMIFMKFSIFSNSVNH